DRHGQWCVVHQCRLHPEPAVGPGRGAGGRRLMSDSGPMGAVAPLHGNAFRVDHVMGMPFSIDIRDRPAHEDPHRTEAVLDRCFEALRAADSTFSLWRPDTPMSRLSA